ncbi:MAG TPA: HDOD domain-containing protein, partial [Dissulfurispiraceae bacterium]|nr:HDOD domain-containing protein [Dissulfurispiraceae bacterium]
MLSESKDPKKSSLDQLLKGNAKLPTPPVIAIRIMKKTKEENLSFSELEEIIASDPALTIKILSIANSPVFGSTQTVDSISRAINILGVNAIRNIALSFVIASSFRGSSKDGFDYDLFWKNALTRAVAANILGRLLRRWSDDVYICALLADIGKVVMFMSRPDDYLTVHYESNLSESDECALERSVFGFDHQEIGYEVLRRWGIPDSICLPIAHHHVDGGAP